MYSTGPSDSSGSGFIFKGMVALTGLTVGGVTGLTAAAYYSPSLRNNLEKSIPYSKEAFSYMFPKPESSKEQQTTSDVWPFLPVETSKLEDKPVEQIQEMPLAEQPEDSLAVTDEPVITESEKSQVEDEVKTEEVQESSVIAQEVEEQQKIQEPKQVETKDKETEVEHVKAEEMHALEDRLKAAAKQKLEEKDAEEAAENNALQEKLESLVTGVTEMTRHAMEAQHELVNKIKQHTENLKSAMEDNSQLLDKTAQWTAAVESFEGRQELTKKAEELVNNARENLERLKEVVSDGRKNAVTKKNKALSAAQETFSKLNTEMNKMASELSNTEKNSKIMLKYKDLTEKAKTQFQKELDSIMPRDKTGEKVSTEEKHNALIAHAHQRISQYQQQLAEQIATEEQRMEQYFDKVRNEQQQEDNKLVNQRIKQALLKAQKDFLLQKQEWKMEAKEEFEDELKLALSRQAAAHTLHLEKSLRDQEIGFDQTVDAEKILTILEEKQKFQEELAGWITRLQSVETAVDSRAEDEKSIRQAQELWLACTALCTTIEGGMDKVGADWEEQLKPLNPAVEAIEQITNHSPFVAIVTNTIPEEALQRGVWTPKHIKHRFKDVHKVSKEVAKVDETGGSLYQYVLSYLLSKLVVDRVNLTKESDEVDVDKMDTYEILAHAKYFVEKDDLEQALKFMNQLKGMSRNVALDWINETKLLVETKQATQNLEAFASASGIGMV